MPKLAKATSPNDGRVAEAVALLVKCPALTLEQVMLAVRFTAADAANLCNVKRGDDNLLFLT